MTADEWYLLQATRALNQSIGRVIRHKDDYGAILLCDQRFEGFSFKTALSSWIRPHVKKQTSFGSMIRELRHFFVTAEKTVCAECVSCNTSYPPELSSGRHPQCTVQVALQSPGLSCTTILTALSN